MASEAGASSPDIPVIATVAPAPAVPVDALLAVLESFVARVEAVCGRKGGKKCPLPPPSSRESSDSDSGLAVAQGPCSEVSEDADQDHSDSEEDSVSGSVQEKALVGALCTTVRETLKLEDIRPGHLLRCRSPLGPTSRPALLRCFLT